VNKNTPIAISSVFIMSRDPKSLAAFYQEVIGLPLSHDHEEGINADDSVQHYERDLGEVHFAIHLERGSKDLSHRNDAVSFALTVENLDHYLQRLASHNIQLLFPPMDLDFGRLAGIHDPDGNTVQFVEIRRQPN
jgi:predicted enzyme related to lactoylglutathione lyase